MNNNSVVVVGSFVQDLAFNTSQFPAPGETRIGKFKTGPGGKGFNQAVACNRQGVSTLFVGAVGADLFAAEVRKFIADEGLGSELQTVSAVPSGAASIVVNERAENLIVVALGANDALTPAHIDSVAAQIAAAQVLVCQLENSLDATERALQIARDNGVRTILNPAPINAGVTASLLALADIVVPNETEFAFMLKHLFDIDIPAEYWLASDAELHAHCRRANVPHVVLTLGDKGCFVSHDKNAAGDESEFYRVAAQTVNAIDTTGAGDAFNGGFAAGLVRYDGAFRQAIEYANVVAGLSTEQAGTAPAMPTLAAVEARM